MNDLSVDIGYKSINHYGEYLCGDHVDVVQQENNDSKVVVLADGLKSGVKASILSTLTAKIISTMMAHGLSLEECVNTIAATLPISSEYGVAYSTFTIMHIIENETMSLIQYDNPLVIMIRDCKVVDYPKIESIIDGKKIYQSKIPLRENDIFIAMSDGCPGANDTLSYNKNWTEKEIGDFMETISPIGYTAKTLASILIEECNKLYDGKPIDDTTACIVRVIKRSQVNLIFGPPANRDDCDRMMSLFFSKEGMSEIDGVDLVTEGVVTIDKVLKYAKDYVSRDESYTEWSVQHDASALISRILFEEATDINFFVGRAVNPAHQDVSINFNVKMSLVEELSQCLRKMGKSVKVSYF